MSEPVLEALCATLDQLSVAILILSASGRILFANQAANDMLEAGWPIRLLDGSLQGTDRFVSAALKNAIELVSSSQHGTEACHFEVCLAQPSADRPGAIAELRPLTWDGAQPAIALFIMQAGQATYHGIDGIAEAFGLSKAETRILKVLTENSRTCRGRGKVEHRAFHGEEPPEEDISEDQHIEADRIAAACRLLPDAPSKNWFLQELSRQLRSKVVANVLSNEPNSSPGF